MKTKFFVGLLLAMLLGGSAAQAKLKVVATLPDFASIAREVGGHQVEVSSIARGTEDAHFIDARPSFIRVLNQADVLIEGGAALENGWLPPLVNNARNKKILPRAAGNLVLAPQLKILNKSEGPVDRSMGDVHPEGNPHFWFDPGNVKIMARVMAESFGRLEPAHAAYFAENARRFEARLDEKLAEWQRQMEPFRGAPVVSYHRSYDYLLAQFGLVLVGTVEPKPGVEPSPAHLNDLIPRMKSAGVKAVLIEPFRSRKTAEYVARMSGAKLVVLPDKVESHQKVKDYLSLLDYAVAQLADALK